MGIRSAAVVALAGATLVACGSSTPPGSSAPDGNANDANLSGHVHGAPPPPPAPLRAGERFVEVGLPQAYKPAPPEGGTDEYRCFLVDPKLTEAAFLSGSQFLPQNNAIVHHAIMYSIPASEVEHAKSVDAAAEGDGWQCFGGSGLGGDFDSFTGKRSGATFIGAWAPGAKETLIGEHTGYPVEPGSQIVLQIHYNLLATGGNPGPTDQSSVRLRLMPSSDQAIPLQSLLLPAPIELPCTPAESGPLCDRTTAIADLIKRTGNQANAMVYGLNALCNHGAAPVAGNTQHCDIPMRQPMLLYAVAPHMHLLGRSIKVELNPDTPNARVLLDQPAFNFDEQTSVPLPQPLRLNRGDVVRVTCTHDATLRSQLPELKPLKPRYVVWGDGTSDEMCLGILTATTKV